MRTSVTSLRASATSVSFLVLARWWLMVMLLLFQAIIEALKALGHQPGSPRRFYNVVNAVEKVDDCIWAVSDARKQGEAAGF